MFAGGVTANVSAAGQGDQYVYGGTAHATTLSNGGAQIVDSGGLTDETDIVSGGAEEVASGGTADNSLVSFGGTMDVLTAGISYSAATYSGGVEMTYAGGVDSSTSIGSGGVQYVYGELLRRRHSRRRLAVRRSGGYTLSATDYGYQEVFSGGEAGTLQSRAGVPSLWIAAPTSTAPI